MMGTKRPAILSLRAVGNKDKGRMSHITHSVVDDDESR